MKKLITFLMSFALVAVVGLCAAVDYRTVATTPSTSQTGENYDTGAEITQYFTYTTPSALATNKTVGLVKVPAYARILDCEITTEAHGGAQTFEVGLVGADNSGFYTGTTADDTDFFLTAFSVSNAVNDTFANFSVGDSNAGYPTTKEVWIVIRTDGAALATNKTGQGVARGIR